MRITPPFLESRRRSQPGGGFLTQAWRRPCPSRHAWRHRSVVENFLIFSPRRQWRNSPRRLRKARHRSRASGPAARGRQADCKATRDRDRMPPQCAQVNVDDQARRECARLNEEKNGYAAKSRSNSAGSNCVPSASVTTTCHPSPAQTRAFTTATSNLVLSLLTVSFSLSATIL
jgi:hypothetical protein